jgi:hypothetical protein
MYSGWKLQLVIRIHDEWDAPLSIRMLLRLQLHQELRACWAAVRAYAVWWVFLVGSKHPAFIADGLGFRVYRILIGGLACISHLFQDACAA